MKCAIHPEVETSLRCGKCGQPICPKCMVQTPVGAKCPKCAQVHKLPTYSISTGYYLRAIGTALGMAVACGLLWELIGILIPFFYLNFILAAGVGYAIGGVISRSVNRKRGTGLAVVAGIAVVLSYVVSIFLPWGAGFWLFDLLALALGIFIAVNTLR